MAKLFEEYKLNESSTEWAIGHFAMVLIKNSTLYFVTDKNRPAKREFERLEAIIKLKAIDRDSNQKWIGDIVWVGEVITKPSNAQILGTPISSAMSVGTGSGGGRKINRLIVNTANLKKDDLLVNAILKENTSTFKRGSNIPLEAQVYTTAGLPIKTVMKQYQSSNFPISLAASIIMGKPATFTNDKEAIILPDVFDGDRTQTKLSSYLRMLNQAGYTFTQDNSSKIYQNYSVVTYPLAFPNAIVANKFKEWFSEKIKEFQYIDKNMVSDFASDWRGISRDDDGFKLEVKSVEKTPHEIKSMAEDILSDDTSNADIMGGEDAASDLLESAKKQVRRNR